MPLAVSEAAAGAGRVSEILDAVPAVRDDGQLNRDWGSGHRRGQGPGVAGTTSVATKSATATSP